MISLLAELKGCCTPRLFGEELFDVVLEYGDIVFGLQSGKQKFPGFGLTHNWVKRSIFWELPYWKTNLLCHNFCRTRHRGGPKK
jgi:hypothetical protein